MILKENAFYYSIPLSMAYMPQGQRFPILASCFECAVLRPTDCWVSTFQRSYSCGKMHSTFLAEREHFIACILALPQDSYEPSISP